MKQTPTPQRAWLGVVSADHAARAAQHGWIQLNHGKRPNLARLHRGDGFAIYSPTLRLGEKKPLRQVTQLGIVSDDEPYLAAEPMTMGARGTIRPWRRSVEFAEVHPVAVAGLDLDLTADPGWGYRLRFGVVELGDGDFLRLREAMTAG